MKSMLSHQVIGTMDHIVHEAHELGRDMLFEHEVYAILNNLGIDVPAHVVVENAPQISEVLLKQQPGPRIVLKVVTPGVGHKQNVGGVKVVAKSVQAVRADFQPMAEVFNHQGIPVQGVLLVEWVDYSQELGNEVLLGFRESETFGPVISFSNGGSDAEHFATHFSTPNLILAPIDRQWAEALLASTHIYQKYVKQGKDDYVSRCAAAGVRFSDLALSFSNYCVSPSRHVMP